MSLGKVNNRCNKMEFLVSKFSRLPEKKSLCFVSLKLHSYNKCLISNFLLVFFYLDLHRATLVSFVLFYC